MIQPNKYFIAPDFDCPANTAILIGHILTDPTLPYESLNADSLSPPPRSITLTTTKNAFSATRSQLSTGRFGIWARVLEGAYGGAVGHKFDSSQDIDFEIDEIETSFIKPAGKETEEYIRSCVEDDNVQAFFEGSRFKKSVYIIVGLKIAKGARVSKGSERSRETMAKVIVESMAGRVPPIAVPQGGVKGEQKESTKWRDEKSFVLGYRLRKIICKKGEIVKDVEYNKGALLDLTFSNSRKGDRILHYLVEEKDTELEGSVSKIVSVVEDEKALET